MQTSLLRRNIKASKWMEQIRAMPGFGPTFGATPLNRIKIPGTHDSGTYEMDGHNWYQTQDFSITEQLKLGVRYFDLRCMESDGVPMIHHGKGVLAVIGNSLETDLDMIRLFVDGHPGEIVMVKIKCEKELISSVCFMARQMLGSRIFDQDPKNPIQISTLTYDHLINPNDIDLSHPVIIFIDVPKADSKINSRISNNKFFPFREYCSGNYSNSDNPQKILANFRDARIISKQKGKDALKPNTFNLHYFTATGQYLKATDKGHSVQRLTYQLDQCIHSDQFGMFNFEIPRSLGYICEDKPGELSPINIVLFDFVTSHKAQRIWALNLPKPPEQPQK
ncbi:phosphatidylinositol-specific phospholipase C [Histomonas meleagridis]|uniref:phosphatidylinositol-specific phospholipase C n=1 Tax=Histomonas meleagridis TaxID=135588 RepID=UPI003559C1A3|nr:phosphatidylinositol-specific phospholipase C [Histomonas meleagridis]KAH0800009.1 phosphatidylinositol-specific phospholipase C [Histomonas meleagridis]